MNLSFHPKILLHTEASVSDPCHLVVWSTKVNGKTVSSSGSRLEWLLIRLLKFLIRRKINKAQKRGIDFRAVI